jgi:hypothetical protein
MSGEPHITKTGLDRIIDAVVGAGKIKKLSLPGLSSERAPVFPGGVAILAEVFETLRLETMMTAEGALREGILFDMLGRLADEDARVRTVRDMERRYHVDADQATRVEQTALAILEQVMESWLLSSRLARQMLCWASRLHEIGLDIAHAQYHRHCGYAWISQPGTETARAAGAESPAQARAERDSQNCACMATKVPETDRDFEIGGATQPDPGTCIPAGISAGAARRRARNPVPAGLALGASPDQS